jgi:hypothetical protein
MGLQDFYIAVRELYPQTTTLLKGPRFDGVDKHYDHVFFDMNNALYLLASTSKTDKIMIRRIFWYISSILQKFPVKKSVYIALDGPGPMAKILLQRERRLEASRPELTARFTPGTTFMTLLKHALLVYVSYLATLPQYEHLKFFVSGADREGEGEFKIFEHMRHMAAATSTENVCNLVKGDKCLVVGNDSDLIVMGMNQTMFTVDLLRCEKLNLWKHYNLEYLKERLCSGLLGDREHIIRDFMVLCLLNGGDYLPKCATFKFKQCWINYCRLKQRPENASRSIVSAVTPQEDSQGMDLKFLAEIVKVSALRESYHEVVWLDKKGKPGFKLSKESPSSALSMLSQIIFGHPPLFEQSEVSSSSLEVTAFIATHPTKLRVSITSEKKFEDGSIPVEISRAKGSFLKEAIRRACISALHKESAFMKEMAKRLTTRDFDQIMELLSAQTWDLDELIKSEPKDELNITAAISPIKSQVAVEYLAMIIWVANYWTSHCLSFNYFFPYIFGPTVYDLLALAANPNHPALQHTDTEVNLHVKLNEFGQGTQIVSLPEVRARTVPDAVSDVGTMSPLMFCAAISSANLFKSIVPKPFANMHVGSHVLTPHVNTTQKTIYFDNKIKEFNEEAARIVSEHKDDKDLEENYVKFQPTMLVFKRTPETKIFAKNTGVSGNEAHISEKDLKAVSEAFPYMAERIAKFRSHLQCLSEDKRPGPEFNGLKLPARYYNTPSSLFNKAAFNHAKPTSHTGPVDLLRSKPIPSKSKNMQIKTFVTVLRRFIK